METYDLVAKNILLGKQCFKCAHYDSEDGENINIEYCCRNDNKHIQLPDEDTCIYWEEDIYFKYKNDKIAKSLLLDNSCINCYYNDDWEHPHNGSDVKNCRLPNHNIYRKNGVCKNWKKK